MEIQWHTHVVVTIMSCCIISCVLLCVFIHAALGRITLMMMMMMMRMMRAASAIQYSAGTDAEHAMSDGEVFVDACKVESCVEVDSLITWGRTISSRSDDVQLDADCG